MHMSDALLSPAVAGTMYAASTAAAIYSIHKVKKIDKPAQIPVMGVMGAFVFAAQMINFTIPGTGSSGHLCGGMLLSAMIGPEAGFLTMIGVLLIQCLLFADGGILALGANVWNMAFYGCFIGGMLIWKLIMKKGMSKKKIITAAILGSVLSLQLGAFSVTVETLASGITELPFKVFLSVMQPIHLAIGLVEGIITAVVLIFVYEARPEMMFSYEGQEKRERLSGRVTLAILLGGTVVIAGALSLFASRFPDGLEWSMEKVAGSSELAAHGVIYEKATAIQEKLSILPDYGFKSGENGAGTSFSGIVGAALVIVLCIGCCYAFKFFRKKRIDE